MGPGTAFTRIVDVTVGKDGRIYVADQGEQSISVFDDRGDHERTFGGRGEGPGEFENLFAIGWASDQLWASDVSLGRVTYFTPDGDVVETLGRFGIGDHLGTSYPSDLEAHAAMESGLVGWVAGGTRSLGHIAVIWARRGGEDGTATVSDTLAVQDLRGLRLLIEGPDMQRVSAYQPFQDEPLWDIAPDGASIVVVGRRAASSAQEAVFSVARYDSDGATRFSVEVAYTPQPIPSSHRDEVVETATTINESVFRNRTETEAAVREQLVLPAYYPPVTAVVIGHDGTTWLRGPDVPGSTIEWMGLDEDGGHRRSIELPADMTVYEIGSQNAWGTVRDDLGVFYVVAVAVEAT